MDCFVASLPAMTTPGLRREPHGIREIPIELALLGFLEILVTQGQFLNRFHSMPAKPPVHGGSTTMVSSLG